MRSEVISARVPQRLFLAITAIAEKEGKKVSEVVREAIAMRVLVAELLKPEPAVQKTAPPAPPAPPATPRPPAKRKQEGVEVEIIEDEEELERRVEEMEKEIEEALKS